MLAKYKDGKYQDIRLYDCLIVPSVDNVTLCLVIGFEWYLYIITINKYINRVILFNLKNQSFKWDFKSSTLIGMNKTSEGI